MKKVLSLLLAVVLVCSMATVAFATVSYTYECDRCHGIMTDSAVYTAHIKADVCATCPYCNYGFATADDVAAHKGDCRLYTGTCDYCGDSVTTENKFNAHVEACKAKKYFNIPLAKIAAAVENFLTTTDWNNIVTKVVSVVKTVIEKADPVISNLLAKIPA